MGDNKERLLSEINNITEQYPNDIYPRNLTLENSLEDIQLEYEISKKKAEEQKKKSLVSEYKNMLKFLINNIPGFQENKEINDLIDKHTKEYVNNIDNYTQIINLNEKRELLMLGSLAMAGVFSISLDKK